MPASVAKPVYTWTNRARTVAPNTQVFLTNISPIYATGPTAAIPAVVTRDVVNEDGQVLITTGSPAELAVVRDGSNRLALALESVTVDGNRYLARPAQGSNVSSVILAGIAPGPEIRVPADTPIRLHNIGGFHLE